MALFVPHPELARLLGAPELTLPAATVGELLEALRARIPPEDWRRMRRATLLVNGRNANELRGEATPLKGDDEVWMVFPAAGG